MKIEKESLIIIISILLLILLLIIGYFYLKNKKEYALKIYFFDAGKADAILVSKDDKYIMIDTGEESLKDDILSYFKNNNIKRLDYLIITHFDKDHVGSASHIINNIEVDNVLQSNSPKDSTYYNNYIEALNNKNITPITVSNDYEIDLREMKITVNGPNKIYDSNESNNSSLITSLIYNDTSFLFMGDAENNRIKDYLDEYDNTYNFLKVPYHGNYLKQFENLVNITKPSYAVITCSNKEKESDETIDILKNNKIKYYLTRNGKINVYSDGKEIIIKQ